MKLAYIVVDYDRMVRESPGIARKIASHGRAFENAGISCELISLPSRDGLPSKILRHVPFGPDGVCWQLGTVENFDALYMRRPGYASREMIRFLEGVKAIKPGIKILYEVPTYPYDMEYKGIGNLLLLTRDRHWRGRLKNSIDKITIMTDDAEVFGVETIKIANGIDLTEVGARQPRDDEDRSSTQLNVACIANFCFWHGYDRLLRGLGVYYSKGGLRDIVVHMVGDGPELTRYKTIAADCGITERVIFHGMLDYSEMSKIYDHCSLAVACLGCHRKGVHQVSSLKSREYLAKGIPFIHSNAVDVLDGISVDFCMRVSEDDSQIDIGEVVEFHDMLYRHEPERNIIDRIRKFAEENVGMEKAVKPVIAYLSDGVDLT